MSNVGPFDFDEVLAGAERYNEIVLTACDF